MSIPPAAPATTTLPRRPQKLQENLSSIEPLIATINSQIKTLDIIYDSLCPFDDTDETRKRTLSERTRSDETFNHECTVAYTALWPGKAVTELGRRTKHIKIADLAALHTVLSPPPPSEPPNNQIPTKKLPTDTIRSKNMTVALSPGRNANCELSRN